MKLLTVFEYFCDFWVFYECTRCTLSLFFLNIPRWGSYPFLKEPSDGLLSILVSYFWTFSLPSYPLNMIYFIVFRLCIARISVVHARSWERKHKCTFVLRVKPVCLLSGLECTWWSSSFYLRHIELFGLPLLMSANRANRPSFLASAITWLHSCRLLPLKPTEGHRYLIRKESTCTASYENTINAGKFSAYRQSHRTNKNIFNDFLNVLLI